MPEVPKNAGNITLTYPTTIDSILANDFDPLHSSESATTPNPHLRSHDPKPSTNTFYKRKSVGSKLNDSRVNELTHSPKSSTPSVSRKPSYKSPYGNGKSASTAEITRSPEQDSVDLTSLTSPKPDLRHNIFGKFSSLLHKSLTRSRENSLSDDTFSNDLKSSSSISLGADYKPKSSSSINIKVKETNYVFLEYDPITKRKVLNTYEILREIGKGEHGKVKLAKDLINNDLVAIKIVNRKSKQRPSLRLHRNSASTKAQINEYELKIKREIAIMKKCNHKHIVKLREVLDDLQSYKIYLVLEYLEKGEIKWKRTKLDTLPTNPDEIPCCGSRRKVLNLSLNDDDQMSLLSNVYSPNLTFKQSRKILRDVILGLEYLHLQGIVHRDIKPANLLVSSENIVKISDFGVSFASSLNGNDSGDLIDELELAKTAGTPAFFAPELCHTNFSRSNSTSDSSSLEILSDDSSVTKVVPKIDYKIDIWALGVTLYCLLFGKVPFNADSEFELFKVIVNQEVEFPETIPEINSPGVVEPLEFALAKDLLSKLLDKNSDSRIDIKALKLHPFTLMDLEDDFEQFDEFLHLNEKDYNLFENGLLDYHLDDESRNAIVTQDEISNAVVGVGTSFRRSLIQAIKASGKDKDIKEKFMSLKLEHSRSASSEDTSNSNSQLNSSTRLNSNYNVILSEASQQSNTPNYTPSHLSQQQASSSGSSIMPPPHKASTLSIAGIREGRHSNPLVQDVIDSSASSSRRGSVVEAPQIETKRNVGGDLYLTNQSIVDTFKGIQQQDDKRRKSSVLSTRISTPSDPSTAKNSISLQPGELTFGYTANVDTISAPIPVPSKGPFHTRFGGINIANDQRPSSVMSLPLNESFASLDSFDDDYLTYKFQDFKKETKPRRNSDVSQSDSNISKIEGHHFDHINEKFQTFDFYNSMQNKGAPKNQDSVGPTIIDTHDSYCSSQSSTSSESSEDDSGNLTLAFTSKLAPPSRPQFLSLKNRAKSHESNLPQLINSNNAQVYDVPIMFQNDIPEFEDVPAGLLSPIPPLIEKGARKEGSSSTLTSENNRDTNTLNNTPEDLRKFQPATSKQFQKSHVKSPLATHVTTSTENGTPALGNISRAIREGRSASTLKHHFANVSLDDDHNEVFKQAAAQKQMEKRPDYSRSNSITVGILQHNREQAAESSP